MRAIPSARAADQKAEAEALRKIEVKTPKAVRARDACADAYQAKAELWLLIDEVSAQTSALKSPPPASVAQELADKMGQMQVLEQQTEADLAACTRAMSDLTTSK